MYERKLFITVVARDPNADIASYMPEQLELSSVTPERAKQWVNQHIEDGYQWLEQRTKNNL